MNSILSADRPVTDPSCDLFGYAPFAQRLTKVLCNYNSSDPLVLGLYGSWGSGKSTILKFICHNLAELQENERPIIIEFNPWWFSGQEHLAKAFLGQLQAVLPKKYATFKKLAEALGHFSESLGGAIDTVAQTGGVLKKAGALMKSVLKQSPKDVPALKEKICTILQQSGKRIIIMVDDIDRLDAEEIRQLLTVFKSLADFPNVIYMLAFDQDIVVQAIERCSNMPGLAYLEKIIQASFIVPQVDRTSLVIELGKRLDEILKDTPEYLFEQGYWNSIFFDGIEYFFTVPRDIVRFCNTLSVTYPAVKGEVNAVDFIVIESIRVFIPDLYMYIRENKEEFIGDVYDSLLKKFSKQKIENILNQLIPEKLRKCIKRVLKLIFPYLEDGEFKSEISIRRSLYIRDMQIFHCYFRFNTPLNTISNSEMQQWLRKAGDPVAFGSVLLQAREHGLAQVRMFLDRLRDYIKKDIQDKDIPAIISVLFDIGDNLIESPSDAVDQAIFDNRSLLIANLDLLGRRLSLEERLSIFNCAMQKGNALATQGFLLKDSENTIKRRGASPLIPDAELIKFKDLWLKKVDIRSVDKTLLSHQNLVNILDIWLHWSSNDSKIKNWCVEVTASDDGMFLFMKSFIYPIWSKGSEVTTTYHIDPQCMEPYIDVADFAKRIHALQGEGRIPQEYKETTKIFLQGIALWREGKTPEEKFILMSP